MIVRCHLHGVEGASINIPTGVIVQELVKVPAPLALPEYCMSPTVSSPERDLIKIYMPSLPGGTFAQFE